VKQSVDQESVDSYHVRGVEGSCAEHLIIEFYMAVVLLAFILIIISIPSPLCLQCFDAVGWAAGRASGL